MNNPYSEIDTLNMLAHCRRNGLGIDQAIKFLVARTPVKELWALKEGEDHPDAAPDKPCPDCPYKPDADKDDPPTDAPKGGGDKRSEHRGKRNPTDPPTLAEAGWDKAVGAVNQRIVAPTASADEGGWDAVIEQVNSTRDATATAAPIGNAK
jgi:hypothetical protein